MTLWRPSRVRARWGVGRFSVVLSSRSGRKAGGGACALHVERARPARQPGGRAAARRPRRRACRALRATACADTIRPAVFFAAILAGLAILVPDRHRARAPRDRRAAPRGRHRADRRERRHARSSPTARRSSRTRRRSARRWAARRSCPSWSARSRSSARCCASGGSRPSRSSRWRWSRRPTASRRSPSRASARRSTRLDDLPANDSFPSGHTAASVAVYVGLALLITSRFRNRGVRLLAWAVAILVPVFVAFARMYRGMHHPLDVAGGLLIGIGALLVLLFACRAAGVAHEARSPQRPRVAMPTSPTDRMRRRLSMAQNVSAPAHRSAAPRARAATSRSRGSSSGWPAPASPRAA